MPRKRRVKKSDAKHLFKFFKSSKTPIRSILATLTIGAAIGVAFEEMVGIGTWHSFNQPTKELNICFTPPSGCGSLIAQQIAKTRSSIHMQAFGLTSKSIIYQLKSAQMRGVQVNVLLDGGNLSNNDPIYQELRDAKINVKFDKMPGIAHNKIIILDKKKVITGSFNFTQSADTKNAENVLLIESPKIAKTYLDYWYLRRSKNSL